MLSKIRNDIELYFHDFWLSTDIIYESADAKPKNAFIQLKIQPLSSKKSLDNVSLTTTHNVAITAYDENMYAVDLLVDELLAFVEDMDISIESDITYGYSGSLDANLWYQDVIFTIVTSTGCSKPKPIVNSSFDSSFNKKELK